MGTEPAPHTRRPRVRLAAPALLAAALASGCAGGSAPPPAGAVAPAPVASDARVQAALERTCYACHADRSAPRWYAKLAFSYWFAGSARKKLDFSAWPQYDAPRRDEELEAIAATVRSGDMPPWDYTLLLSSAKLAPDEKEAVTRWASQPSAASAAH